jgi:small-conductance mechanosensitive channel
MMESTYLEAMESLSRYASQMVVFLTQTHWFGNSLRAYLIFFLLILIGFLVIRVVHRQILHRLQKWASTTPGTYDDVIVKLVRKNVVPSLYALLIYHATGDLVLQHSIRRALDFLVTVVLAWQGVKITIAFVSEVLRNIWSRNREDHTAEHEKSMNGILTIIKVVVWIMAGILAMDNLGIKVSAFMAGLGITGIAVALAAQAVLGDLFAYFVIFFDKPFEVGHSIAVDGTIGEVEHIGLKTTRLRSLSGEQVIFSNKHLTDSKVQNFKKMTRRRAVFHFEVEYATSETVLRAIPPLVQAAVQSQQTVTFDRCHMTTFADSGLRFEVVMFIEVPDYNAYLDIQQEVQWKIKAGIEKLGGAFAFPTRTMVWVNRPGALAAEAKGPSQAGPA